MLHTLIFLHLPKTGGTSFKFALQELLPPGALIYEVGGAPNHEVVRALMAMDATRRAQLKAVMAHVPYGLHTLFPGAKYVTMLREPIARVLSTYYFAKSRTEFEFSKKIAAGMTIEEFAADVFNDNAQVRRLLKYRDISRDDVFFDPPAGRLKSDHLDDAKDTLERCAVVGLAERYNEFLDCVAAEFGLPFIPRRDDNVTAIPWHREEISEQTIDRLREINWCDVELYKHAKKLAAEQIAKQVRASGVVRHMRPLYTQASGREALEIENKRLEKEAMRLKAETVELQANTARLQSEAVQFQAEAVQLQSETVRLQSETARLQSETAKLQSETVQFQAETVRLEGELANKGDECDQLLAKLSRLQEQSALSQAQLAASIEELRIELKAVYSSNSWRVTEPLRRLSEFAHKATKRTRPAP